MLGTGLQTLLKTIRVEHVERDPRVEILEYI